MINVTATFRWNYNFPIQLKTIVLILERIANLEGVAVGVANRNESVLCSKVIGRVRSGGFNVLPDIFGGMYMCTYECIETYHRRQKMPAAGCGVVCVWRGGGGLLIIALNTGLSTVGQLQGLGVQYQFYHYRDNDYKMCWYKVGARV